MKQCETQESERSSVKAKEVKKTQESKAKEGDHATAFKQPS